MGLVFDIGSIVPQISRHDQLSRFAGDEPIVDLANDGASLKSPFDGLNESGNAHYPSITNLRANFGKQKIQNNKFNDSNTAGATITGQLDCKLFYNFRNVISINQFSSIYNLKYLFYTKK
jgi:hypothetical protein